MRQVRRKMVQFRAILGLGESCEAFLANYPAVGRRAN
jgi:hypothetical protein